jgi:DNA-binding response OmpR family regulator
MSMDVLIVERDELLGAVLADALAEDGISAAAVPDEKALALPPDQAPLVVITGMNRGHNEDLAGMKLARCLRKKWPTLCIVYLASLWPGRLGRDVLTAGDRFLEKPLAPTQMVRTVRQLMASGVCRRPG